MHFFATQATVDSLPLVAAPLVTEEIPLRVDQVNQDSLGALQNDLAVYNSLIAEKFSVSTASRLPSILANLEDEKSQMTEIIALAALQLVLLALVIIHGVVSASAKAREHEVALARLRGHGRVGVLTVGLLEPLAVLAVAVPVGIAIAWLLVRILAGHLLLRGTPVIVDSLTLGAAAIAFAGGSTAAALGGSQLLVRRLHDQLRSVRANSDRGRFYLIGDIVAITLALAGLLELAANGTIRGGKADPLAVIAPGLLVLAVKFGSARRMLAVV